ncbi:MULTISPECIES: transcription repressor NadR [unclassified Clostridioides]|uniref:transcription repressor NadR n=1 Tax=unclassified Clostridioides TaxID=2635829 RepID=UPI001D118C6A|nr:transcription repressor NadR [Clostridioides sp. ES-S-0048-02]MCC0705316.1 transcription repressor NadR [Clostridioides sp. ES-S-0049-02]MCC0706729.1 transcription repressor NadR [Clostridioides sp. ES-S-0190-01]
MNSNERRNKLIDILKESKHPVKGGVLAELLNVSRQVIVQDIALIRAKGFEIIATPQGYIIYNQPYFSRQIKCKNHRNPQEIYEELRIIVDLGGIVKDVIVNHPTYGQITAELNIYSKMDIDDFMIKVEKNEFKQLSVLTECSHIHTIEALKEKTIEDIIKKLDDSGILS